jgi:hypothetical protein
VLRKGVEIGLRVFVNRRLQSQPNIEEEYSECETFSDSPTLPPPQQQQYQERLL